MKNVITAVIFMTLSTSTFAEGKFSAEFLLGSAKQKSSISGGGSTSGSDTSVGIRGVYQFNPNLAAEVAYQDYGTTTDSYIDGFGDLINDQVSTDAITLGLKGILPLSDGFSLSGRLGLSKWDAKIRETDSFFPGVVFRASDSGTDLYYGFGAQYLINPRLSIGAEFTMSEMDASIYSVSVDHEVSNFAVFLSYSY